MDIPPGANIAVDQSGPCLILSGSDTLENYRQTILTARCVCGGGGGVWGGGVCVCVCVCVCGCVVCGVWVCCGGVWCVWCVSGYGVVCVVCVWVWVCVHAELEQ